MDQKQIEELVREEKRCYAREWRAKNKDRVKATNRRYWEKRALARLNKMPKSKTEVN